MKLLENKELTMCDKCKVILEIRFLKQSHSWCPVYSCDGLTYPHNPAQMRNEVKE